MSGIDYSKRYKDYAKFLPAVSEMYVRALNNKNPKREYPISQKDLNFLDPNNPLYFLPCALYSAGQAAKSDNAAAKMDDMFGGRDRSKVIVVGDSGGYQIQTTAIKWNGDKTRHRMMTWLENMADYSMILDFPTGGINAGSVDQHLKTLIEEGVDVAAFCREIGFDPADMQKMCYATCLKRTMQNNDYFVKHRRPGKTKFLNVIQGRNMEESQIWYDNVKHYPFEAWSLAGQHKENFQMTMTRFIQMRDDGLLKDKNWCHILGVGKISNGAIFTSMQRAIRDTGVNENFVISYDVSSPYTLAAYGKCFFGYTLERSGWGIHGDKVDGREFLPGAPRAKVPFLDIIKEHWDAKGLKTVENEGFGRFVETEVGKLLTMDQVCVNEDLKFTSTWDVVSYALMMSHNQQVHLEAVLAGQDMYDKGDVHHVPDGMLRLKQIIPEIFQSEKPYTLIERYRRELNFLAGETADSGVPSLEAFHMPSISSHNSSLDKLKEFDKVKVDTRVFALDAFEMPDVDEEQIVKRQMAEKRVECKFQSVTDLFNWSK